MATYRVRIKRSVPCIEFNEFKASKGWYEVDEAKAEWCRSRRINDLSPDAPLVFDVMTKEEARIADQVERRIENPVGTVDSPTRLPPSRTTEGDGDTGDASGKDEKGTRGKAKNPGAEPQL